MWHTVGVDIGVYAGSVGGQSRGRSTPRPSQDWTFSSRTRSHRTTVLCIHKLDPLGLLLPAPQTVPEVLFLPTSQAQAPSVGSLPAYLKHRSRPGSSTSPYHQQKPQKRWLTEQRSLDQPPFICTSLQTTQSKAPLCHSSTIFHKFL